jgi:hypothetical protein
MQYKNGCQNSDSHFLLSKSVRKAGSFILATALTPQTLLPFSLTDRTEKNNQLLNKASAALPDNLSGLCSQSSFVHGPCMIKALAGEFSEIA